MTFFLEIADILYFSVLDITILKLNNHLESKENLLALWKAALWKAAIYQT
jgi:hypothetical protein